MKAETKKTRWLLIALLFGSFAAAGLSLLHHHASWAVAEAARSAATPTRLKSQQPHAVLLASIGGKHVLRRAPVILDVHHEPVDAVYSNTRQLRVTGQSTAPAYIPSRPAWSSPAAESAAASSTATPSPSNRPAAATSHLPQGLGNSFASTGYAPLDCELPAGCGATGFASNVSRQPSGTSGAPPIVHDSPAPQTSDDSHPQTGNGGNGDSSNTGDTGTPTIPGKADLVRPGTDPVASAPELDPATLGGAITLLLGSLVVLRRRARATH